MAGGPLCERGAKAEEAAASHGDDREAAPPPAPGGRGGLVRCSAICLRRREDRWGACEGHLRRSMPEGVEVCMFEAVDGAAARHLLPDVDAVEEALNMRLYRGWPVCETDDLRCLFPEETAGLSEADIWLWYVKQFRSVWPSERCDIYVNFHCRHSTLGEIAAAMSHLAVIDKAIEDGLDVQVVFEDDARPSAKAVPALLEQVALLERLGKPWDLIYIRSSKYDRGPEYPYVEGSPLLVAVHRKVTDAYALSRSGMAKIASSGFRDSAFAFDDFVPALYSRHPRRDVEQLPCVQKVRAQGFICLTFPDALDGEEPLSTNAKLRSDTNRSPCILGDHGATCSDSDAE